MDICFRELKESNKSRFDSYSVRNRLLIISHITFRGCRVHISSDNLSQNSCICKLNVSANSGPESKVAPVTYIPPELPSDINELFQDAPHSGLNFDKYDEIPVKVTGKEIPSAIDTFEQAGILEQCSSNIKKAKFIKPTPIQKHAIPIVLAGRDLMACAQTGSGKTVSKENDIFKISAFSE